MASGKKTLSGVINYDETLTNPFSMAVSHIMNNKAGLSYTSYAHTGLHFRDADPDIGFAVHSHKAGRAVADCAEQSSGAAKLMAVAQATDSCGMKSGGNRFFRVPFDLLAVIVESNSFTTVEIQDRVF